MGERREGSKLSDLLTPTKCVSSSSLAPFRYPAAVLMHEASHRCAASLWVHLPLRSLASAQPSS